MDGLDETTPDLTKTSATEASNPEITCYIHSVSPVKNASSNKRKYFDFCLQTRDEPLRALYFVSEKQTEMKTLEQVKSPVKIQNYMYDKQKQDVLITKYTKVVPMAVDNVDFPHTPMCNADGLLENISSLQKVAAEQVVSIKAEVVQMSGSKFIHTQRYGSLKKQEVIIRDNTSSTKVVLWEEYVDCLEMNKTYLLSNLRMKGSKSEKYLNTAKTEKFIFKETEPFTQPLVQVHEDLSLIATTWTAKILGIQQATKQSTCVSCNKIVQPQSNGILAECTSCKMTQMLSSCPVQWYLKIFIQNTNKVKQNHKLSFYPNLASQLLNLLEVNLDFANATETDFESLYRSKRTLLSPLTPLITKLQISH